MIPKLHFKYAYPLDRNRRQLFEEKNSGPYPSIEDVKAKIGEWRKVWDDLNADDRIFKLLIEITGVNLPRDLELCIYGAGLGAMSYPLIMPIARKNGEVIADDKFIRTAIHEIIHRLVADPENNAGVKEYWRAIKQEYAVESILTQNHIIVYAVLGKVLGEVFGKEKANGLMHSKTPDYERAIAIVAEKGAENLIEQFREYLK